jgi:hypothetical protein
MGSLFITNTTAASTDAVDVVVVDDDNDAME